MLSKMASPKPCAPQCPEALPWSKHGHPNTMKSDKCHQKDRRRQRERKEILQTLEQARAYRKTMMRYPEIWLLRRRWLVLQRTTYLVPQVPRKVAPLTQRRSKVLNPSWHQRIPLL